MHFSCQNVNLIIRKQIQTISLNSSKRSVMRDIKKGGNEGVILD
jgi:hypothetical protein